ncbi:uncharacterized protein [Anabrus simplex]|uniref:uncharacterized protein isoform X2 n=1 Tax=Anabrus simplex TaxID=316456 RepID=UPI0035A3C8EC
MTEEITIKAEPLWTEVSQDCIDVAVESEERESILPIEEVIVNSEPEVHKLLLEEENLSSPEDVSKPASTGRKFFGFRLN